MFEHRKYRGVRFDGTQVDAKFEGKLTCTSKNDMSNFANFHQSTFESLKSWTFTGSFHQKQKMFEFTIYRGVMYHKNKE